MNVYQQKILSWSSDNTARLWDVNAGVQIGPPLPHELPVEGARFTADEKRILTWSDDNSIRLWNATTGAQIGSLLHEASVLGAVLSKDERSILSWSRDRSARLWNIAQDDDFPRELYELQIQAITGLQLNVASNAIEFLSQDEWLPLKNQYMNSASEHYASCKFPEENLFRRYYPEEARKVRAAED